MKNKMQAVDFKDVAEFLDYLPEDELEITKELRRIILDCLPNCKEKLSFNVPFYSINKSICFIWPASVLWGNKKSYTGVRLGFSYGALLNDEENYLDQGNRKQVCYRDFTHINQVDEAFLSTYLYEALHIDAGFRKKHLNKGRETQT
jgi:hypothetical protein